MPPAPVARDATGVPCRLTYVYVWGRNLGPIRRNQGIIVLKTGAPISCTAISCAAISFAFDPLSEYFLSTASMLLARRERVTVVHAVTRDFLNFLSKSRFQPERLIVGGEKNDHAETAEKPQPGKDASEIVVSNDGWRSGAATRAC